MRVSKYHVVKITITTDKKDRDNLQITGGYILYMRFCRNSRRI